jgi:phosphohistidine phosphatase
VISRLLDVCRTGDRALFVLKSSRRSEESRPRDALRPLTSAGERDFREAALGLACLLPRRAVVLTSPFARARQTAELLASSARTKAVVECEEPAAGRPVRRAFKALRTRLESHVVVVGHEPDLGRLLSLALGGDDAWIMVKFEKGGAACLAFRKRIAPHRATLVWMLPPQLLRAVKR